MKKFSLYLVSVFLAILIHPISHAEILNDTGQMSATKVFRVIAVKSEQDIVTAIEEARTKHLPISIMGKQHSQGGQSVAPNAIVLNMLTFNKIIAFDIKKKQVTVQSGIVWSDLQKFINQNNLAIRGMQSPNIFTVGGSMSVNAHGDDIRVGGVGKSVVAFHLILADGKKLYVTPQTDSTLWSAVIGGYGLLGVVSDVTLQLTDNNYLASYYEEVDLKQLPAYFQQEVLNKPDIIFFYAHLNIVPGEDFLQKMYVITYRNIHRYPGEIVPLDDPDRWNIILAPMFNFSRYSQFGKEFRWQVEQKVFRRFYDNHMVTRNNAMEKPVSFAANYRNSVDADWLQEYFIPLQQLPKFIEKLREVVEKNKINLLNVTIRYVPAEKDFLLSYAKSDSFAVVLYFNQNVSLNNISKAEVWTRDLINAALALKGNYYLPYQPMATREQFQQAYPAYQQFLQVKKKYDPQGLFQSQFYLKYLAG